MLATQPEWLVCGRVGAIPASNRVFATRVRELEIARRLGRPGQHSLPLPERRTALPLPERRTVGRFQREGLQTAVADDFGEGGAIETKQPGGFGSIAVASPKCLVDEAVLVALDTRRKVDALFR